MNPFRLLAARVRQWRADRHAARLCLRCRKAEVGTDQIKCGLCRTSEEKTRPIRRERRWLKPDWAQRNDKRAQAPIPNQHKESNR